MKPLLLILIFFSACSQADFRWSSSVELSSIGVDDPDGGSSSLAVVPYLSGTFDLPKRGQRVTTGVGYVDFSLDASSSKAGQNVSGFSVFGNWERRTPITRKFSEVYLTVGAKYLQLNHTERHTLTSDGFLDKRLGNRSGSNMTISVGANISPLPRSLRGDIDHQFGIFAEIPVSSDIFQFGARYQTYF